MPVEIKELHIRVAVDAKPAKTAQAAPNAPAKADGGGDAARDALIAECVEQVLQILQSKRER
jgi:Family of unknown function (DUF5908)